MPSMKTKRLETQGQPAEEAGTADTSKSLLRAFIEQNTLLLLIAFRLLNAFTINTFFQPDEYYQSLEPAGWLVFGDNSGAWMTWEWKNQLRSALHPALFATVYRFAGAASSFLRLPDPMRAFVLIAAPKTIQAFVAALGDYYTYKLGKQIYGKDSLSAWCALLLTAGSAWQWFCSTRTFSNCIETTLTITALYNWPFHWALGADEVGFQVDEKTLRVRKSDDPAQGNIDETTRLRRAILTASTAVILRPTNVIVWITLILMTFGRGMYHHGIHWEVGALIREGLLCSSSILALSGLVDRIFYGVWTFPPWSFLKFNVFQSLAVFYGNNNWHYYISQGYLLLLTVALPPALVGVYHALRSSYGKGKQNVLGVQSTLILHRLAVLCLVLPATLSILSHKEVRFIYPILPALHILAALPLARMLGLVDGHERANKPQAGRKSGRFRSRLCCIVLLLINVTITYYLSRIHNSGLVALPDYLRTELERYYHPSLSPVSSATHNMNLTLAVLMPCHSVPWRSHLQYTPTKMKPGISGWALTCEPPLNLNTTTKQTYLDEADWFYQDPILFLKLAMSREVPLAPSTASGIYAEDERRKSLLWSNPNADKGVWLNEGESGLLSPRLNAEGRAIAFPAGNQKGKRAWPDYLIFFEQLEPVMRMAMGGSAYVECKRLFNSHGHDDWRRTGDVVVWCLYPERAGVERRSRREFMVEKEEL